MEEIERQGTINNINDLYEDGYKDLYLDMCQHFKYERECNARLEKENNDLRKMIRYMVYVNEQISDEYITRQKDLIDIYRDKMEYIAKKYKK